MWSVRKSTQRHRMVGANEFTGLPMAAPVKKSNIYILRYVANESFKTCQVNFVITSSLSLQSSFSDIIAFLRKDSCVLIIKMLRIHQKSSSTSCCVNAPFTDK